MIRLAVRVASEHAELVLAELLELAPAGVEEVHGEAGTVAEGTVEYAVYGAPGELPALPDLKAAAGDALVDVRSEEIPDDWHERWRQFHRPVLVEAPVQSGAPRHEAPGHDARPRRAPVPSLLVRPPWETASATRPRPGRRRSPTGGEGPAAVREIVIDPGQAFGTGAHATTRMCLELLLELAAREGPGGAVVDVGTGSGVLAIAAATLGFAPVLALDNEPESVAAARENAAVNAATIEVRRFDLRTASALPWRADALEEAPALDAPAASVPPAARVVLANLLRPLLLELAERMSETPSHLIAGGLLIGELDEVVHAFGDRLRLRERERRTNGEWAAVWLSDE